ncbi:hypothetical protein PsorP6_007675 [Peronosclerospora sorghi]|uniref:Uncharacterized protein n=1 Tax=Peronosclerospora sorghi TaxID=230839 RepID=A0ACC0WB48_9STRA|nr:hypothetical protein PsorP6_007675 [Peronosclerospora sorghi]
MGAYTDSNSGFVAMPKVKKNEFPPHHIAVIMDGNRRYGENKYGSGARGHVDGTTTVMNFMNWSIDAGIEALTVFAFSTDNWKREKVEVDALLRLIDGFINNILVEALDRNIKVRVLASDSRNMPAYLIKSIKKVEDMTQHCNGFHFNICLSYGARDEIVSTCKKIAREVVRGETSIEKIDEDLFSKRMLTAGLPDPDIMIRTSGEFRLSNFLLFQMAYTEFIFLDKCWPEVTRDDLQDIIAEYNRRKRRFGK